MNDNDPGERADGLPVLKRISGKVARVIDGDTLDLFDGSKPLRVRLAGIDAPELGQFYGYESKKNLEGLVQNQAVVLEFYKLDRYGRLIGKVILGNEDVNLKQVESGCAWHFKEFQKEQSTEDRRLFSQAEQAARSNSRGLWAESNPTPPWIERKNKRLVSY